MDQDLSMLLVCAPVRARSGSMSSDSVVKKPAAADGLAKGKLGRRPAASPVSALGMANVLRTLIPANPVDELEELLTVHMDSDGGESVTSDVLAEYEHFVQLLVTLSPDGPVSVKNIMDGFVELNSQVNGTLTPGLETSTKRTAFYRQEANKVHRVWSRSLTRLRSPRKPRDDRLQRLQSHALKTSKSGESLEVTEGGPSDPDEDAEEEAEEDSEEFLWKKIVGRGGEDSGEEAEEDSGEEAEEEQGSGDLPLEEEDCLPLSQQSHASSQSVMLMAVTPGALAWQTAVRAPTAPLGSAVQDKNAAEATKEKVKVAAEEAEAAEVPCFGDSTDAPPFVSGALAHGAAQRKELDLDQHRSYRKPGKKRKKGNNTKGQKAGKLDIPEPVLSPLALAIVDAYLPDLPAADLKLVEDWHSIKVSLRTEPNMSVSWWLRGKKGKNYMHFSDKLWDETDTEAFKVLAQHGITKADFATTKKNWPKKSEQPVPVS